MDPIKQIFTFGGLPTTDLSADSISDPLGVCGNYSWLLAPVVTGVTGSPTYTFQGSTDGVTWFDYKDQATNVPLDDPDALDDDHLTPTHIRVVTTSNGGTGTASFTITYKR